jgi:single-strand DNA-binding protein
MPEADRCGTVELRDRRRMLPDACRTPKARKEDGDMSQENTITLRGFVTAEPKFGQTASTQTPYAEIRLGSTASRLNKETGAWEDGETSYYTVKCWRRLAVNVKGSLRKGDMILVRGKVMMRSWVDDQQRNRVQMQVEADSVGHDLAFGWSHFNRGDQSPWNASRHMADAETGRPDAEAYEEADDPDALDPTEVPEAADGQHEPAMAEADFEKLTSGLGAEPDVAPVF